MIKLTYKPSQKQKTIQPFHRQKLNYLLHFEQTKTQHPVKSSNQTKKKIFSNSNDSSKLQHSPITQKRKQKIAKTSKPKPIVTDLEKRYAELVKICSRMNEQDGKEQKDSLLCVDETIEDLIVPRKRSVSKTKSFKSNLPPIKEDSEEDEKQQEEQYIETARNNRDKDNSFVMRSTTADDKKKGRSDQKNISVSPFNPSKIKISVSGLMKSKRKVKSSMCTYR